MKCDNCIALYSDYEYERYATEYYCAVGEEIIEFADGSAGCLRKSKEKLKRDIKIQDELEAQAFVEECKCFLEYLDNM